MRINHNKKVQIRKKGNMTLHRKDIRAGRKPGRSVKLNYDKIKKRKLKKAVDTAEERCQPSEGKEKYSSSKKRQRAEMSAPSRKGEGDFKKEVFVTALRREAEKKEDRLEGERELFKSAGMGAEIVRQTGKVSNLAAGKEKPKWVKTAKMKIHRVDTVKNIRSRTTKAAASAGMKSQSRRNAAKSKSKKFKASAMISNFIRKSREERSADEELGVKRAMQNHLLAGAIGLVTQVVLVALPVILIIALVYNSPLALAMPPLDDGERIQEVLAGYYQDFNAKLSSKKQESGTEVTYANSENSMSNFRDVLMVYMVKYYTGTGEIGTVVTDKAKENLKTVFDEMNYYKHETTTRTIKAGESLGTVVTSGYCNCVTCCGQWSGGATASGAMPTPNHTIAVDANNPFVPMGTKVIFNGITYTVEDTGNFARYGVQFDVYFSDHTTASNWGHRSFEAYLADGEENEIEVTSKSYNVHQLTYEDYIALGKLTAEQEEILREMMTSDIWEGFSDGSIGAMVAAEAMTKIGCAYSQENRYAEGVYDCSSFVFRLYRDVAGVQLPSTAAEQGEYCYNNGMAITQDMLQPGDLIFYSYETNGRFMNISHVAIYVGDGMMVHAANPRRGVVYDPLNPSNIGFYARPY